MKRLGALAAGGLMILVAVLVRGVLDDDSTGANDSAAATGSGSGSSPVGVVVCDPVLVEPCATLDAAHDDLEVIVEPAGTTRARLEAVDATATTVGIDAWITIAPLPDMVVETRRRAGAGDLIADVPDAVARSPLVLVGWSDRWDVLEQQCGTVDWRCVGDQAARAWSDLGGPERWGRMEPGLDDRNTSATGLLVAGSLAVGYVGDADFATNDLDPSFRRWWDQLSEAAGPAPQPSALDQMLRLGPASYDLVGSIEAVAEPAVAASRDTERLRLEPARPATTADVVVVPVGGASTAAALTDDTTLTEALADAGWYLADAAPGAGTDLPPDNGLPRAGVLEALRRL